MTLVTQLSDQCLGKAGSQGTHDEGSSVIPVPGLGGHGHNVVLTQFVQVHSIFVESRKLWSPQVAQPMHLWRVGAQPSLVQTMWSVQATERKVHKFCGETTTRVQLSHCWWQSQGGKQGAELPFSRKLSESPGKIIACCCWSFMGFRKADYLYFANKQDCTRQLPSISHPQESPKKVLDAVSHLRLKQ